MGFSKITAEIFFTRKIEDQLSAIIAQYRAGDVFLVLEENVEQFCLPVIQRLISEKGIEKISILAGEQNKGINSVVEIWKFLSANGADRKSLLVNFGGGMLTDLAGFAASTFKRGIDFVNIPTTLLSQVDASVGGKTGINHSGLKNEVGTFREPRAVLINVDFLKTLDRENFLSGFAEMIKHGLIKSPEHVTELRKFDIANVDYDKLESLIRHSVDIKKHVVEVDPTEKGIRKVLNFGHTVGHAFESLAMEQNRPIHHGFAVAYGMMVELFLSVKKCNFPENKYFELTRWLIGIYGKFEISQTDFDRLYQFMTHDKKNDAGRVNFTLIPRVGDFLINQEHLKDEIFEALEVYLELGN
jgi:3-dehydroquinate synthase